MVPSLQDEYAGAPALLVRKSDLVRNFAEDGQLTGTVAFLSAGNTKAANQAFNSQGLRYHLDMIQPDFWKILLLTPPPSNNFPGASPGVR